MSDITQSIPDNQNIVTRKWKDMGDGTWAEIIASVAIAPASAEKTGIDSASSVGVAGGIIVPAGAYASWVTVQNTHSSQTLAISFSANPVPGTQFTIQPGAAMTFPFGLANPLYGAGSGAGTTYALIGA